jgi:PKD repeat protein
MKKTILILLIALGVKAQQQVNLQIVRVTPTVCAGDSVHINYKAAWPSNTANQYTNYIYMGSTPLVIKSWQYLKARPKEYFAPVAFDSAYWINAKVPNNTPVGVYTISSTGAQTQTVYVSNCTCTVTADFSYSVTNMAVSFTSTSIGTNSNTVYNWDFGVNTGYQVFPSVTSYTYFFANTYTVSLLVTNPTCSNSITKTLIVSQPTLDTGINELRQDGIKPVYFDLYGRPTERKYGVILIEVIGNVRRKVVISE